MRKFEIGSVYFVGFAGDHELCARYLVTKRTAKTITIEEISSAAHPLWNGNNAKTCRINDYLTERNGAETIFPVGRYSMAPVMRA